MKRRRSPQNREGRIRSRKIRQHVRRPEAEQGTPHVQKHQGVRVSEAQAAGEKDAAREID